MIAFDDAFCNHVLVDVNLIRGELMKTLTLRGLDFDTYKQIRERASASGNSMNRYILKLLHDEIQADSPGMDHHDLDEFFGSWDDTTFNHVMKTTTKQRGIDLEIWS